MGCQKQLLCWFWLGISHITKFWKEELIFLHSLKRKKSNGAISRKQGGQGIVLSCLIHLLGDVVLRGSHWYGQAHLERKHLVEGVPSVGMQITQAYQSNLCCLWSSHERRRYPITCLHPSYAGHYLSLKTAPTITWWTVFQVLSLRIPDGVVFTLQ